jgi:hypothetical protein
MLGLRHSEASLALESIMGNQTIKLSTLTQWMKDIESGYAQRGIHEIDLSSHDYYLCVSTDTMFDVYAQPQNPMPIGSIADDVKELTQLAADPEPFPTAVDIERLGNVLRAVSEVLSQ